LFWQYVNGKLSTRSFPNSIYYNSDTITITTYGSGKITDCFAQYFFNAFYMPSGSQNVSDSYNINFSSVDFNSCMLTFSDVYNELNEITIKSC